MKTLCLALPTIIVLALVIDWQINRPYEPFGHWLREEVQWIRANPWQPSAW